MKTTLLCSLLIVQLIHSDADMGGSSCGSLNDTENNPPNLIVAPGSTIPLTAHDTCTTVLVYQNQPDAELQVLPQQRHGRRIKTPPIYMNTSGVYCTYKNCTSRQTDWCCIKVTVPTKMQIQFPESPRQNTEEFGSCSVSAWPRPPENETIVYSSNTGCAIKMLSVRHTDIYITVVFFTMYANSSCRSIICSAPSKQKEKYIDTPHATDPTTRPTEDEDITDPTTEKPTVHINSTDHQCGGALGMHRTTSWTIVFGVFRIATLYILGL